VHATDNTAQQPCTITWNRGEEIPGPAQSETTDREKAAAACPACTAQQEYVRHVPSARGSGKEVHGLAHIAQQEGTLQVPAAAGV
jgi:hypothetical protein